MTVDRRWSLLGLVAFAGVFGLLIVLRTEPLRASAAARTFYVSPSGNGADGRSWDTAWRDLDEINWPGVQPADTILLDGGPTACPALGPGYGCGVVYASTLRVGASGTGDAPITIRLAGEPGRNGTAIIDGGLTRWARCSADAPEPDPPSVGGPTRSVGVDLLSSQWIILDGTKWGGIEIRNHTRSGLSFGSSQHVLARYLKIHHNTDPSDTSNSAVGVTQGYRSRHNRLARTEIFRNGQDAVRGAGDYFTLEESYLHDHYCNHPDGIQAFVPTGNADIPDDAGEIRGLVIRRNVFERIGLQAIFVGENAAGHNSWAVDVTIENNLFIENPYMVKSKHGRSSDWLVSQNTFYGAEDLAVEWCCADPGALAPMVIADNILADIGSGATAVVLTSSGATTFSENCLHNTGRLSGNIAEVGTIRADPGFVNASGADLALQAGSACAGKGANVTSVSALLAQTGGAVLVLGPHNAWLPMLSHR